MTTLTDTPNILQYHLQVRYCTKYQSKNFLDGGQPLSGLDGGFLALPTLERAEQITGARLKPTWQVRKTFGGQNIKGGHGKFAWEARSIDWESGYKSLEGRRRLEACQQA